MSVSMAVRQQRLAELNFEQWKTTTREILLALKPFLDEALQEDYALYLADPEAHPGLPPHLAQVHFWACDLRKSFDRLSTERQAEFYRQADAQLELANPWQVPGPQVLLVLQITDADVLPQTAVVRLERPGDPRSAKSAGFFTFQGIEYEVRVCDPLPTYYVHVTAAVAEAIAEAFPRPPRG